VHWRVLDPVGWALAEKGTRENLLLREFCAAALNIFAGIGDIEDPRDS